ncbi:hypothetical protein QNA08_00100 [Chelatococcus sp. SYSU_G07232]|uniref:HTH crp-type domain-containing protein n=1 Tax=Chelatococcus albus TaxID=3047466 RepID=A0ABT7AC91_9HYPH|nr:hypothetical protein [Chelatococcus sp. SYSU_G07232]MDJ1156652.1 hypothetical protein [Chelatococcus sp. SYSU_G07232]
MLIHNYYAWRCANGALPTLSALQKVAGQSARQTAGFVAALKAGRFIVAEPDPGDRRVKRLRPAPAMVAEIGRSVRLFVAAVDEIEGRLPPRAAMLGDADRLGEVLHRSAAYVLANGTLIHPFPRVLQFAERDCGYPLLAVVMGAHYAETVPGTPPAARLSIRAPAERFQVSPSHISNLLREAEQQGWFAVGDGGRLLFLRDGLLSEFEQWAACQMVHFDALAGETDATDALGQADGHRPDPET